MPPLFPPHPPPRQRCRWLLRRLPTRRVTATSREPSSSLESPLKLGRGHALSRWARQHPCSPRIHTGLATGLLPRPQACKRKCAHNRRHGWRQRGCSNEKTPRVSAFCAGLWNLFSCSHVPALLRGAHGWRAQLPVREGIGTGDIFAFLGLFGPWRHTPACPCSFPP